MELHCPEMRSLVISRCESHRARTSRTIASLPISTPRPQPLQAGFASLIAHERSHARLYRRPGWRAVSEMLANQGQRELATHVRLFLDGMPPPQTEKERTRADILTRTYTTRLPHDEESKRDPRLERTR